jgi:hypothetical protein
MELEDDTIQWALHISQTGRKGEGKQTHACAAWPGCAAALGQTDALASSRSSKPAGKTERERELCPFLFIFLNLKFSLKKTILKLFDL